MAILLGSKMAKRGRAHSESRATGRAFRKGSRDRKSRQRHNRAIIKRYR